MKLLMAMLSILLALGCAFLLYTGMTGGPGWAGTILLGFGTTFFGIIAPKHLWDNRRK